MKTKTEFQIGCVFVQIEERFDLAGYAYYKEGASKEGVSSGRVLWEVRSVTTREFSLALSSSWGLPNDATVRAIKMALREYVTQRRTAPAWRAAALKGDRP